MLRCRQYNNLKRRIMSNIPQKSFELIKIIRKYHPNPEARLNHIKACALVSIRYQNLRHSENHERLYDLLYYQKLTCEYLGIHESLKIYIEHSILLCVFLDAFFEENNSLFDYYTKCIKLESNEVLDVGEKRFLQETTYMMLMRLDDSFEQHLHELVLDANQRSIVSTMADIYTKISNEEIDDVAALHNIHSTLVNRFSSELPEFLQYTFRNNFHMYVVIILSIPFLIEHSEMKIHSIFKYYNRIEYLCPALKPTTPFGMFTYIRFFTITHITIIYEDIVRVKFTHGNNTVIHFRANFIKQCQETFGVLPSFFLQANIQQ